MILCAESAEILQKGATLMTTEGDGLKLTELSKQQLGLKKRTQERFCAFSGSMTNFYFSTKSYTQGKRH